MSPGASLPLSAVPPHPGAGGRGLTGQMRPPGTVGSGRGWSVRSPGPWLRMLRQPYQLGESSREPPLLPLLGAAGERSLPCLQPAAVTEPDAERGVREGRAEWVGRRR